MNAVINYKEPAKKWSEGCLLGNGFMGQAIYGGVEKDIIDLSESSFFSGADDKNIYREDAAKYFELMRSEALNHNDESVKEYTKKFMGKRGNFGTNLPIGKLEVAFKNIGNPHDYNRELLLNEGICQVGYTLEKQNVTRECFSSNVDSVFVYRVKTEGDLSLNFSISLTDLNSSAKVFSENDYLAFRCKALETLHSDGITGTNLLGVIHVSLLDGEVIYEENEIKVSNTHDAVILLAMETDYTLDKSTGKELDLNKLKNLVNRKHDEYTNLKLNHITDFSEQMNKQTITIDGDELTSRMHQFGRYLLLSSSRKNSVLPAHLQGVWNDNVACNIGWSCDMHLDINTQMNYWISESGNLVDSHMPLFHWMEKRVIPSGRETARKCYGKNGWVAELVSNSHGYSAPYWNESLSPCPASGIWMASDYMEHYRFTKDHEFLENHVYPVLKEAVDFFKDYIFLDTNGYYVSGPSISPENGYLKDDHKYYASIGPTFEILVIRELFKDFIEASQILEKEEEQYKFVLEAVDKLLPYQIDETGEIMEWNHEYKSHDLQHRHTSHLLGLFPYHQINPEETKELAQAAKKTIESKLIPYENWEDTGWARNLLILYNARLHDGETTYKHIRELQKNLTNNGLLVMHPPTRGAMSFADVYELDGNTGFSMAVIEMLVQCFDSVINILPAIPKEWNKGKAKGIVLRGGITIDIEWDINSQIHINLISKTDTTVNVKYKDTNYKVVLVSGITKSLNIPGKYEI